MFIDEQSVRVKGRRAGRVHAAIIRANRILGDHRFALALRDKKDYTHTPDPIAAGRQVYSQLSAGQPRIASVRAYKFALWHWRVLAQVTKGKTVIHLNTRRARSVDKIAGTIIHEYMHILGWGHGSNSSKGKENALPNWAGSLAANWHFC